MMCEAEKIEGGRPKLLMRPPSLEAPTAKRVLRCPR
jgi:hypothetical protein